MGPVTFLLSEEEVFKGAETARILQNVDEIVVKLRKSASKVFLKGSVTIT